MERPYDIDEMRRRRRIQRKREIRRRKRRRALIRRVIQIGSVAVLIGLMVWILKMMLGKGRPDAGTVSNTGQRFMEEAERGLLAESLSGADAVETDKAAGGQGGTGDSMTYRYTEDEETWQLGEEDITSSYAVFVDTEEDLILASRDAFSRMVPASMTKVLTALVAAEHMDNLDDTFTITIDITDYSFRNGCSNAGFDRDETVTVRDLLYGAVLPSGADASLGLAVYVAGSQEAFVELMNEKLEELGLSETSHFTNCVGLYDENHYTTAYDMAVMMEAAIQNETCREIFSSRTYTTSSTEQHPEGIPLSNWFVRRIEDKETNGILVYGKTGYVDEPGSCAVSFGTREDGRTYICVTANSGSKWWCINDHAKLYQELTK